MLYLMFTIQILLMLGLPVALWLLVRRRPGVTWGLIGAGALTFIASQVVHLPLNWALGLLTGERGVALWPLPLMALIAGLSAGVCEEGARYLVLRFWRREARSWDQGVAFGAGHGGIEAILLGLLVVVNLATMAILHRAGPESLGLSGEMAEQVRAQIETFWSIPWYMPLLGGLERAFALTIQIAMTLLVVRSLTRNNPGWLGAAILGHALVDGVAVWLVGLGWAAEAIEGVVLLLALGAGAIILALHRAETRNPAAEGDDVSRETLT